ncbi:hypothetical protein HHK36_018581 [Tetracentron sinense]|uniref:DUF3741 domain-containing protein n=1 Tax=Tetracentron sinense TaxID=13715 RepID=A0A834Z0F0_TETSI|nr:hypothetical protein HHK36_018581 [Tetracentron sinense]
MKISFPFSSSSSTSFNGNLNNSQNAVTGFFFGILRRLLCTSSLPTHPSDHTIEVNQVESEPRQDPIVDKKIEDPATPGIVARLMGLDSMPETNWVRAPGSITRSRSVNSADCWADFDPLQKRHRRVRSSLSFREVPTYLQLENEDFFLLSFDNVAETTKLGSKERKSEMGFGELKQRRTERSGNKDNRREKLSEKKSKKKEARESNNKFCSEKEKPRRKISNKPSKKIVNSSKIKDSDLNPPPLEKDVYRKSRVASKVENPSKLTNQKQVLEGAKSAKKKRKSALKKVEPECNSENSSPVSVLEVEDFLIDPETPSPGLNSQIKEKLKSNSRMKLSSELVNYDYPSPNVNHNSITNDKELTTFDNKDTESRKTDYRSRDYSELCGEICKLAEEEMKETNWIPRDILKLEDFEELGIMFELQILDRLLNEVVDELIGLPMKNFAL